MNSRIVPRTGLRKLTPGELHSEVKISKRNMFDANVHLKLENSSILTPSLKTFQEDVKEEWTHNLDDEEPMSDVIPDANAVDATGKPITPHSMCDALIHMELLISKGETEQLARVM